MEINYPNFDDLEKLTEDIQAVTEETVEIEIVEKELPTELEKFILENNILKNDVMDKMIQKLDITENDVFTIPQPTTITLGGLLSNVSFHEEDLIKIMEPNEDAVVIECNYGRKIHASYNPPEPKKKSNRGRRKKEKKKRARKVQGSGSCFSSQLSVFVRTGYKTDDDNDPVYKFKIFRTGDIQLPGAEPELLEDIIDKAQCVVKLFRKYLNNDQIELLNLCPSMKNYKFEAIIPDNKLIDILLLRNILLILQAYDANMDMSTIEKQREIMPHDFLCYEYDNLPFIDPNILPEHPIIYDIKYTKEDTKLYIRFLTPITNDPEKLTKVNIFMKKKINFLGAFDEKVTEQIYNYLKAIFTHFREYIISGIKESPEDYMLIEMYDNLLPPIDTNSKIKEIAREFYPKIELNLTQTQIDTFFSLFSKV